MNLKVDFTIHTNVTTDDPEQVPVIAGNKSRDNPEPRHKIRIIQRTYDLPRDLPVDQLMPDVRDSVWIEPQMIRVFQPVVLTKSTYHHHLLSTHFITTRRKSCPNLQSSMSMFWRRNGSV